MSTPFAHEVDYWKTGSKRSPAQWLDLTRKQLTDHGAKNILSAEGEAEGREAYMIQFDLMDDTFKIVWPVLPLPCHMKTEANQRSARVQAVTTLYHDVKACCVKSTRYGHKAGFFQFKLLPDGRTVQQASDHELLTGLPEIMQAPLLEHKRDGE